MTEDIVAEWITTLVKDYGADINARSWVNEAPLHRAIIQHNVVPAKTLLQLGADVNARGFGSMTPLHYFLEGLVMRSCNLAISADGYKIVANTIVQYPSWMWSSFDDHSQRPRCDYAEEPDNCLTVFFELFKHAADKLDFNVQSFLGNLPLHCCWVLLKSFTDAGNIMQGLADPNHFILAIPLIMLKYATREQLLTKNFSGITPFEVLCQSYIPTLNTKSISGIYPAVKEAFDIVFMRCFELIGDTIDINSVVEATSMPYEYNVIELLANKAKENGKFNMSDLSKSSHESISRIFSSAIANPAEYALFKDIIVPICSKHLDRELTLPGHDSALHNFVADYTITCGTNDDVSRPKMLNDLLKSDGIDWNVLSPTVNQNLLHATLSWFRNISGEALLYNQIWTNKRMMEADRLIYDLIKVGVNPHHKNKFGQSFADLVPQYEKILANHKLLVSEEKKAIQKENYFEDKKPTNLMELMEAISFQKN
jgi:ankyrin repeat protein